MSCSAVRARQFLDDLLEAVVRDIRELMDAAELEPPVRRSALAILETLARAEARVHGIEVNEVNFHEIVALNSVADVARDVPLECAAAARATSLTVRHLQAVVRELMLMIRSHGLPLTVLTAAGRDATWMEMLVLAKAREAAAARPARV